MGGVPRVILAGFFVCALARGATLSGLAAENVSAENLSFSAGPTNYKIARLDAEGATLSALDIARIFDAKNLTPWKERLARLTAGRIVVPEIVGETAAAGAKQRFIYRDVRLENVVAGHVGALRAASLEQTIDRPQGGSIIARYGPISARNVDLAQIAHVYGESGADGREDMRPLQDEVHIENAVLTAPDTQSELKAARLVIKDVKARATSRPFSHWINDAPQAGAAPTAEQGAALALAAMETIGGFEVGLIEAQDVSASSSGAQQFAFDVKRAALAKIADSIVGEFSVDGLSYIGADSSRVALVHAALRGLELRSFFEQSERRFPRFAHIELSGLDVDIPDASVSDTAREKFRLASGVADFGAYRDGAPTRVSSRVEHSIIDLTERAGAPADAQLIGLGYKEVDLSWIVDGEWREKEQEFVVRRATLEGKDMGRIDLTATLANVSPLVFSPSPIVARAAALSVLARQLDASLENVSLVDRTIDLEAKSKGVDPAKLRADYATSAEALVLAFFDGSEKARPIAAAIAKFVASPRQLRLRLQSAKGIGVFDALTSKPSEILRSADVEAKTAP